MVEERELNDFGLTRTVGEREVVIIKRATKLKFTRETKLKIGVFMSHIFIPAIYIGFSLGFWVVGYQQYLWPSD